MRKPPADAQCDAYVGHGVDGVGKPVVYRCRNMATETRRSVVGLETWLCARCVAATDNRQQ